MGPARSGPAGGLAGIHVPSFAPGKHFQSRTDRRRNFKQLSSRITLLSAVEDGIYVSDQERTYFMGGGDPGEAVLIDKADYPAIPNNLHPSMLDELGLIATMGWLCTEYLKAYPHFTVQKQITIVEEDIAVEIKVVIYRVLQEALNNFARHGKGDRVDLSLSRSNGVLALTIRDNGQGFDVENAKNGLGLESMRERVELSGGEFQIESTIGQGTTIRAIWSR